MTDDTPKGDNEGNQGVWTEEKIAELVAAVMASGSLDSTIACGLFSRELMYLVLIAKQAEGDPDRWAPIAEVLAEDPAMGHRSARGYIAEMDEQERLKFHERTRAVVGPLCQLAANEISVAWSTLAEGDVPETFHLHEVIALLAATPAMTERLDQVAGGE